MSFLKTLLASIITIVGILTFFSPILISVLTGNYWYIFLFFVTWIPTIIFMVVAKAIID